VSPLLAPEFERPSEFASLYSSAERLRRPLRRESFDSYRDEILAVDIASYLLRCGVRLSLHVGSLST
jgi:hypothetical protein